MKTLQYVTILLFLMLISYAAINTLTMFKLQYQIDKYKYSIIPKMQDQITELYSYKDHFLRRLNRIEYHEVLPPEDTYKGKHNNSKIGG